MTSDLMVETVTNVGSLRVPPHDAVAEQSVLGCLLLDNSAWDRIGDLLTEGDFYTYGHRMLYAVIGSLVVSGRAADEVTVAAMLSVKDLADVGGRTYLSALAVSVPSGFHARRYAEIVRERSLHRALITAADEACTLAWKGEGNTSEIVDDITSRFAQLERRHVQQMPRSAAELTVELIDRTIALSEGKGEPGWPTHIPALDRRLVGGLKPGWLYVLAARPAVGKSSFAGQIALNVALLENLPTLFLSQEMASGEVWARMAASVGRVSHAGIQMGKLDDDGWGRFSEAGDKLQKLPLSIDDQGGLTLADIRRKAKSIKGLKVLVIDYLQLCSGGARRRDGNRNSEIEEISRGLKALAKELGVAVLALSQLNRDVEKRSTKRPQLGDLRDSGAIEQDADAVLLMWTHTDGGDGWRLVGLDCAKVRNGRVGEFGLDFVGDHHRWAESTVDIRVPATSQQPRSKGYDG